MDFHLVWSFGPAGKREEQVPDGSSPPTHPIRPHLSDQKIHKHVEEDQSQGATCTVASLQPLQADTSVFSGASWPVGGEASKWIGLGVLRNSNGRDKRAAKARPPWFLPGHPWSWAHPSFLSREWPPTGGGSPTAISLGHRWGAIWSQASRARSALDASIGPALPALHLTQRRYGIPVVPRSFLGGGRINIHRVATSTDVGLRRREEGSDLILSFEDGSMPRAHCPSPGPSPFELVWKRFSASHELVIGAQCFVGARWQLWWTPPAGPPGALPFPFPDVSPAHPRSAQVR